MTPASSGQQDDDGGKNQVRGYYISVRANRQGPSDDKTSMRAAHALGYNI
jgi:hypothetical protein